MLRYAHTNLIARDWERLARFYERAFACVRVPPERDLSGDWLARGTGVPGAALRGVHLRLPGHGGDGPTLEIFEYARDGAGRQSARGGAGPGADSGLPAPDRPGYGHVAFEVDDVAAYVDVVVREGGSRLGEIARRDIPGAGALAFTYARDPEGNVIEIQSWRRDGALAGMAVEAGYDRWAATYDEAPNPTRNLAAAVVPRLLPPLAGLDVLELGCGTGQITEVLAGALAGARRVVAVDLSAGMLARARARLAAAAQGPGQAAGQPREPRAPAPRAWFARCDIQRPLPLAGDSFDVAVISLVLEHVADTGPVLAELGRVLRPGGRAVIAEFHPFRQLSGKQARLADPDTGAAVPIAAHVHTTAELCAAAAAAGLSLSGLGEWIDGGLPAPPRAGAIPRLLTLELARPAV